MKNAPGSWIAENLHVLLNWVLHPDVPNPAGFPGWKEKKRHPDFAFEDFSIFRRIAHPSHYIKSDIFHYFGVETNVALISNHLLPIICFLKTIHKFLTEAYMSLCFP